MAPPRSWPMTLARVRPKWAQKAKRSLLPFRIPYPESGLSDSPKPLRSRVYTVKRCASRPASCSQIRDEDNHPCTSTTAGPAPMTSYRIQTPSSSRYSVSRALSTSLASRPSTMEAARITATTTNNTINVMPMEAMIAQKRANMIQPRRALLVPPWSALSLHRPHEPLPQTRPHTLLGLADAVGHAGGDRSRLHAVE